jgi:hypothetical protein
MNQQPSSKVFQMFLNSLTGFPSLVDNTNTSNCYFSINWDSFFNREQYNYKYCRVRVKYITNSATTITYQQTGFVLVGNFASPYTSKSVPNVVLGLVNVFEGANNGGTARGYLEVDTTTELGVQIQAPQGQQTFNLAVWRDGYGSTGNTAYAQFTTTYHWTAILQFELYN